MALQTYITVILIPILLLHPATSSPIDHETQLLELKIKAITSVELSSMTFDQLPSLFFLYENLVTKRFESIHKNNPRKFEEFRKIHQHYAIKNSFYSLKLMDVAIHESFDARNLEVINNKVNWTDDEIIRYGFLGKQKDSQSRTKYLTFNQPAMADFFIAQYFHDNLIHPKDQPSDDEVELRIRLLLHITADNFNRQYLTNEFIDGMIKDQNREMFSEQVKMIMKYRFKFLLDEFLPDQLDLIEKVSKIFAKDEEILRNLWRVDYSQPYFLRFFRFSSSTNKVYKLKDIADKFFTTDANVTSKLLAENIFRGRNQIMSVLYRIYEKKDQNFTQDILNVTKYEVSDEILTQLSQKKNFLDFVDSSSYSVAEKREFYLANSYYLIRYSKTGEDLKELWKRIQKYFNNEELKGIITQKDQSFNTTHLFHLPSRFYQDYVAEFLNLTTTYLTEAEIKEFLNQRFPISGDSFMVKYIGLANHENVVRLVWNFTKNYLNDDELRDLMVDHTGTSDGGKFLFLMNFD